MISTGIEFVNEHGFYSQENTANRRLLSQLDDFDQDIIHGNAASESHENTVVNEVTNYRDLTVRTSTNNSATNESTVHVKTLEKFFNERIDRETSNTVDTVEDRIQNAFLTAIDSIVAPKIELAIRSINASSGRDVTSVTANSMIKPGKMSCSHISSRRGITTKKQKLHL